MVLDDDEDREPLSGHAGGHRRAKRVAAVLDFVDYLEGHLKADCQDVEAAKCLLEQIRGHITTMRGYAHKNSTISYGDLDVDTKGTRLWNRCTHLRREMGADVEGKDTSCSILWRRVLLLLRVLAYQTIDLSQWSPETSEFPGIVRLMKLALKAGKSCLDEKDLNLALLCLQQAADYNARIGELSQSLSQDEVAVWRKLDLEYLVARTALSQREGRLDIAEHLYKKAQPLSPISDVYLAEKLADAWFEIGKSLSIREEFDSATKWLQRAYDIINSQPLDRLTTEAVDLRLTILRALVHSFLGLQEPEALEKAQNLVKDMEAELGDKLVVLLLEIEILMKSPAEVFDCDSYANILRRMVRAFNFSESSFKLIVHHTLKLHNKSPGLGCGVLDELLLKVYSLGQQKWTEELIIKRLWVTTQQRDSKETVDDTRNLLAKLKCTLSAEATGAAQALIWKKLEAHHAQGELEMVKGWCELALCEAFDNCGSMNRAILERKILECAVSKNNMDAAKSTFHSMSAQAQQEPMTRHLMFKVAIRTGDHELASQCLEIVCQSQFTPDYLYACVLDSYQSGDKWCTVTALKKLHDLHHRDTAHAVHQPALLRCIIRILYNMLGEEGVQTDESTISQDLCDMFQKAVIEVNRGTRTADGKMLFDTQELEWFCRHAYNLGLRWTGQGKLEHAVSILTCCLSIIGHFPSDVHSFQGEDLLLKSLFCRFIMASAIVSLARSRDGVDSQREDYSSMRRHVQAFDDELQPRIDRLEEKWHFDMLEKLAALLVFDLEGAVCLRKWDELGGIIRKAAVCRSAPTYRAMAGCLLRSSVPAPELSTAMRQIISEIFDIEGFVDEALARYIRYLFQAVLVSNEDLALQLLRDACQMAKDSSMVRKPWPREEVEWVATTAFNHGVDCLSLNRGLACKEWVTGAINLAHYCDDGGQLERAIHKSYASLNLSKVADEH